VDSVTQDARNMGINNWKKAAQDGGDVLRKPRPNKGCSTTDDDGTNYEASSFLDPIFSCYFVFKHHLSVLFPVSSHCPLVCYSRMREYKSKLLQFNLSILLNIF
jgi:hypothetical protein